MDAVVGLVVLVAIVWIVRAALVDGGSTSQRGTQRSEGAPPSQRRAAPPADPVERRRQERADEAFVDGVLFAHHFDPLGRHDTADEADGSAVYRDDDLDADGWDEDDVFHDDAGDW